MSRTMGLLDLEKHFAFYGAYHSNPINIIIHIIFVWPIVFTALLLLHSATPIFDPCQLGVPESLTLDGVLRLNIGFIITVIYALFYICLDKKSGFVAAIMCFSCWVGSSFLAARLGASLAFKVGLASQLLCWTGQFLGHGLFEKRAPALLDNIAQAFLMAPFFVLLEVLQSVFGYEPYPGFQARVNAKVESDIKEYREKKQKKSKIT
uniref:Putative endoplasmic reticulum membrane protein C16E8.02 n=1 Tax=Noccaea caerulescens TaxID=107243 RepID=A0A1J3CAG7_NOCCA